VEGEWPVGQFLPVRMTGAMTYDLVGVVESSPSTRKQIPSSIPLTLSPR